MHRNAIRTLIPLLLLLAVALPAAAEWDVDGIEELIPHRESELERARWRDREEEMPARDRLADPPPLAPLRNCAEWEPCTGVMIRYPLGLPYALLHDLDDDVILHVVVSSGSYNSALNALTNQGIDMSRVEWLIKPNDSIWTRDYGPWFVFDGNGEIAVIDHTYNRPWRPNDNLIPIYFAEQQGLPVHSHDMFFAGGNYMTDGAFIGSSTELVYNEAWSNNGMNEAAVDQLVFDYYGINNYMVLDYIESGGIHHIDTWMKMLDEQTCLVKDVTSSHHTYNNLNQRAALLASLPSSNGPNYDVHRVYCYPTSSGPASYTNSLILNDNIYVPTFGNTGYDNAALAVYEAAAPGYTVRGYYYSGFITDDALHCRTKGMMDAGMLRVAHIPIHQEQAGPVAVSVFVNDHSDAGISSVELHYRHNGGAWATVAMSPSGDDYLGTIPPPAADGATDYYIHAADNGGREAGMPRVEPTRHYSFEHRVGDTGVETEAPELGARLFANYPNPFNPSTVFSFELLYADRVELAVYDARGQRVRMLIDGLAPAGRSEARWDGRNEFGKALPSGVYYYRLRAAGIQYSRPATLLK